MRYLLTMPILGSYLLHRATGQEESRHRDGDLARSRLLLAALPHHAAALAAAAAAAATALAALAATALSTIASKSRRA